VVQAVLVMALVSTIGVLIFAVRVAGSRQASASATMSQAARQAAEYGYAEIVAEMNQDEKSYLWVVNSNNWGNVSIQDLKECGVASSADPGSNPISALTANQTLSRSPELSYRLTDYQAPRNLTPLPNTVPAVCTNDPTRGGKFANLMGGTGVITIVGTANRGSGFISTYTLKRTLTVNRAAPIFNNPITAPPSPLFRSFDAADSRFPPFPVAPPVAPPGTLYGISCEPEGAPNVIKCTADPGPITANFKSGTAPTIGSVEDSTGSVVDYFPYIYASGVPWATLCQQAGDTVQCLVKSMTVKTNANMLVATTRGTIDAPVEIFLSENMNVEAGSKLAGEDSGDGKGWSRFRIFGVSSGTSCGSQTITINSFTNSAVPPGSAIVELNLQNAFLWLRQGKIIYPTSTTYDRISSLVGSVCELPPGSSAAAPAFKSTLSNRSFMDGLGGAYGGLGDPPLFRGVFGGAAPIRFYYRGFGFNEQRLSP
jgi:hypothetical protein